MPFQTFLTPFYPFIGAFHGQICPCISTWMNSYNTVITSLPRSLYYQTVRKTTKKRFKNGYFSVAKKLDFHGFSGFSWVFCASVKNRRNGYFQRLFCFSSASCLLWSHVIHEPHQLQSISCLLFLCQLRIDFHDHLSIRMPHPLFQRFDRDASFIVAGTKIHPKIVTTNLHLPPRRQLLTFFKPFLMLVKLTVPTFLTTVQLRFQKFEIRFIFPIKSTHRH